jgi:hypothetical protein
MIKRRKNMGGRDDARGPAWYRRQNQLRQVFHECRRIFLQALINNKRATIGDIHAQFTFPDNISAKQLGAVTTGFLRDGTIRSVGKAIATVNGRQHLVGEYELMDEEKAHSWLLENPPSASAKRVQVTKQNQKSAGKSKGRRESLPKLTLNKQLCQVRYAGRCYDVSANAFLMFELLIEADGDWVPLEKRGISKPSDTKNSLEPQLQALIESSPGKGHRLKRV